MSQKFKKTLIALVLAPMVIAPLSGFGLPGVGDVQNVAQSRFGEYKFSLSDLDLTYMEPGNLNAITRTGIVGKIPGVQTTLANRLISKINQDTFYSEYGVINKEPVKYPQVGKHNTDVIFREGSKVTATAAVSRKLISRVTANLIKMNQQAALGAEVSAAEQDVNADEETQAAVRDKVLAKLRANKDKITAKHRESLQRMILASYGAILAGINATEVIQPLASAIGGAPAELAALPGEVANNPMDAGRVVGIVDSGKKLINNLERLTKELPPLIKNANVLFAALTELGAE